jgi:HEAT repeat protein
LIVGALRVVLILAWAFQDAPSMDALLRDFKSDDPAVRERAVQSALARSAQWSAQDLETLRKAGSSGDADLARRAKETLERIEIRRKAGSALLARLKTLDTMLLLGEKKACVEALYEVSRAVEDRTLDLSDLDSLVELVVRRGIDMSDEVFSLTSAYPHKPYARFLRPLLLPTEPKDENAQHNAAAALMRLARVGGKEEIPLILPFLKSPVEMLRSCAVSAFSEIPDRAVMEPIVPLLKDPNPNVRSAVLTTLSALPARDCVSGVTFALKDEDPGVRGCAADGLGKMGAIVEAASLLPLLRDSNLQVREAALSALALLDADAHARDVLPLLEHANEGLRATAVRTLVRLDPRECIRRFEPLLAGDKESRWEAWRVFLTPAARVRAEAILPLLQHADPDLRGRAVAALGGMEAIDRVAVIAPLLQDPSEEVRYSAAGVLGRLAIHLPKEQIDSGWIRRIRDLEKAQKENPWGLSVALLRLGGKTREEQGELARRMLEKRSYETTAHYEDLFRGLGEVNETATASAIARRFTLQKPVGSRTDLDALFEAQGLKLKGALGWDVRGRSAAGRETSLRELLARHFEEWVPVPEKDGVLLLRWDKAFQHWTLRLAGK